MDSSIINNSTKNSSIKRLKMSNKPNSQNICTNQQNGSTFSNASNDLHNNKNASIYYDPAKNLYHHHHHHQKNIINDEIPIEIERIDENPSSLPLSSFSTSKNTNNSKQTAKTTTSNTNNTTKKKTAKDKEQLPNDLLLIKILNRFIFFLFLLFIVFLNVFSLIILPYFVRKSLSIDD